MVTSAAIPLALKGFIHQLAFPWRWGRGEISYAERGTQMELRPNGNE